MPGYLNPDGSELVGALSPGGVGQALIVDSNGYLRVTAASTTQAGSDGVAPGNVPEMQMGIYNGSTIDRLQGLNGAANVTDWIRSMNMQGKGFIGNTGMLNVAAGNYPLCIFNPAASGKSVLIYALNMTSGTGAVSSFAQNVTVNPAYASAANIVNAKFGGPASAIAATVTYTSTSQTLSVAGAFVQVGAQSANQPFEFLTNGAVILLPGGSANGIIAWIQTYSAGYSTITAKWIEF